MTEKTFDKVEDGVQVSVEYTGTLEDGTVFDKSEGRGPLTFVIGKKMMIPGFEKAVLGMKLNEEKDMTVAPEDAYGPRRDELKQEFPKEQLPKDMEAKKGMMLMLQNAQGHQLPAQIVEVGEKTLTLDLNHPLAGKTLKFNVKVVKIEEAKENACGPDCCGGHDHDKEHKCDNC